MPFPPSKNHVIDESGASVMTQSFQLKFPGAIKAGMFPIEVFEALLRQRGCKGIRIYFGLDAKGELTPILAGVDQDMNDQLPRSALVEGGEDPGYYLYEFSFPCPIYCGDGNALNGM